MTDRVDGGVHRPMGGPPPGVRPEAGVGVARLLVIGALLMALVPVAGVVLLARVTRPGDDPHVTIEASVSHAGDRTTVRQTVRPVGDAELPSELTLTVPSNIDGVGTPDFGYGDVQDGTGAAKAFGQISSYHRQVSVRSSGPRELTATFTVRDDPAGPVAPLGDFDGVVCDQVRLDMPVGWGCLTSAPGSNVGGGGQTVNSFRRCAQQGDVVTSEGNILSYLLVQGPMARLPAVND